MSEKEWMKIEFETQGPQHNAEIIQNVIFQTVNELEQAGEIINYFFLRYEGEKENKVTFVAFGNKEKAVAKVEALAGGIKKRILNYNPDEEKGRFSEDFFTGVKLFELGSRFALASIANRKLTDNSGNVEKEILLAFRHVFAQNLGHEDNEGKLNDVGICLDKIYEIIQNIKMK